MSAQLHGSSPDPHSPDPMASSEPLHIDRYEAIWVRISVLMLVVFTGAIIYASTALRIQLPGAHMRIDPRTMATPGVSPFGDPKVSMIADGEYEAYIRAQAQPWIFTPSEIRIPVGSKLTMYVSSQDVQHGFNIERTNVNVMVLPGQVTKVSATFTKGGIYNIICHEYCGVGHHTMYGRVIVEDEAMIAAAATETAVAEATQAAVAAAPAMTETVATRGDASKGEASFVICAGCHGPTGGGVTGLGKPLTTSEFVAGLNDDELVNFLKVGRAVDDPLNTSKVAMPPKGGNPAFNDDDLYNIVAYLRTLQQN